MGEIQVQQAFVIHAALYGGNDPLVLEAIAELLSCIDDKVSGTLEIDLKSGSPTRIRRVQVRTLGKTRD